jgi:hypothetical protein
MNSVIFLLHYETAFYHPLKFITMSSPAIAPVAVTKKIYRLHRLLVKEKEDFELVAAPIADRNLRSTVLSLAQQNNQYAAELSCYLQSTGTAVAKDKKGHLQESRAVANGPAAMHEKGVLAFCSSNERKIAQAYRRILQEAALYQGLKDMMGYQLNGILSACMQLKLLRSLTKAQPSKQLGELV